MIYLVERKLQFYSLFCFFFNFVFLAWRWAGEWKEIQARREEAEKSDLAGAVAGGKHSPVQPSNDFED